MQREVLDRLNWDSKTQIASANCEWIDDSTALARMWAEHSAARGVRSGLLPLRRVGSALQGVELEVSR